MNRYWLSAVWLAAGMNLFALSAWAQQGTQSSVQQNSSQAVDHRYYYLDSWNGAIGLPDDPFKTLVDADGTFWTEQGKTSLRQGFYPLAVYESPLKVHADLVGGTQRVDEHMLSTRVPISIAHKRQGTVLVEETLFQAVPLDWSSKPTGAALKGKNSLPHPNQFVLMTEYTNEGDKPVEITPVLDVMGPTPGPNLDDDKMFDLSPNTFCRTSLAIDGFQQWESSKKMYKPRLALKKLTIPPGQKAHWVLSINRTGFSSPHPIEWAAADKLRKEAIDYWENSVLLPYDVIQVPDAGMQNIIETAVRETYQMRYIINDLPAFYLGARGYNEYWVLDGSVVDEALDILSRDDAKVDLVVTDLVMPAMSGRELVEHIQCLVPHARILRTSGYVWPVNQEDDGAYLQKPFTSKELLIKIRQLLAG